LRVGQTRLAVFSVGGWEGGPRPLKAWVKVGKGCPSGTWVQVRHKLGGRTLGVSWKARPTLGGSFPQAPADTWGRVPRRAGPLGWVSGKPVADVFGVG